MATFRLHNVRTYVRDATPEEIDVIDSFLSLPDRTAYFRGRPGERIRLFDRTTRSFPSGLLPSVRAQLATSTVVDEREPTLPPDVARLLEFSEILMPHQRAILEAQVASPRGILKASTGGGKGSSLCAAMWCWSTVRWLVVCHSRDIINELAIRYERLTGERPGVLGGGRKESDRRITFTTFAFLYSNRKKRACAAFLEAQHGLMLDEAHGASAPSCATVTEGARNAYLRYAWSATPLDRTDARSALVIGATGPLLTNIKIPELVAADVIAKPTSLWVRHHSDMKLLGESQQDRQMSLAPPDQDFLDEYTQEADGFAEFYTRAIVENAPRNDRILAVVEWIARHDGFPLVLFIQRIQHGMMLRDALRQRGFRTEFAWGKVTNRQRSTLLHDLAGELQILVANKVLQAGVDQEAIRTVFNAGAGSSSIMTLQQAGRAMRIGRRHALGKTTCRIVDLEDAGHEWLERHAKARQRACRRAGIEIQYIPESESLTP